MKLAVTDSQRGSSSTVFQIELDFRVLVFVEGGKPENPEKTLEQGENQQQTQPTYVNGNRTWATLVGGECTHHCATPAPKKLYGSTPLPL